MTPARRRVTIVAVAAGLALFMEPRVLRPAGPVQLSAQQVPVFRGGTSTVAVAASVRRGNNVVLNLNAADFALTDNGVPQKVDAVAIETLSIDVSLFLDTSGSTAGKLDDMKADMQEIVKLLRPGDRIQLLTIGDSVYQSVPWVEAGSKLDLSFGAVGGISLIHDALMFALLHRVDTGRRHLIVGMTDRQDCGSVIPSTLLFDLAGRSESVMHLVDYSGGGGRVNYRVRQCTPRASRTGESRIVDAAERTGGELHRQSRIARAFKTIFDDFRQSYVLRYTPTGVDKRGWHPIVVTVPGIKDATIRARQGYYSD